MQNIAQMIFPHQTSPTVNAQPTTTNASSDSTAEMSLQGDISNLLLQLQNQSNSMDSNLLSLLKNQKPQENTSNIPNDFSNLLGLLGQQAINKQQQENSVQMQENDLSAMLALLTQQQQPQQSQQTSSPTATSMNNNFLEQLQMMSQSNQSLGFNSSQNSSNYAYNYGSPSKDSYCELCEKNFCNRYFLKTHKLKKHGIHMDDTPGKMPRLDLTQSPAVNGSEVDEKSNENENKPTPQAIESMLASVVQEANGNSGTNQDLLSLLKQIAVPGTTPVKSEAPVPTERFNCDQCDKDFSNQAHLIQHQITHLVNTSTSTSMPSVSSNSNILNMLPQGLAGLPFMLPGMNSPFIKMDMETPSFTNLSPITSLNQSLSQKPSQKRQYTSTSKNFCEICKKEVCNKYFLRTHMLKMHNIIIDENKTVIANIDTQEKEKEGSVMFRCDICSVEVKSRTELRDHKKDLHGIQPLITPNPAMSRSSSSSITSKPSSTTNSAIGTGTTQGSFTAFEFPPSTTAGTDSPPPSTAGMSEFRCTKCDHEYPSVETLIEHIGCAHEEMSQRDIVEMLKESASSMPMIKCDVCEEPFETEFSLQIHRLKEHSSEDSDEAMRITQEVALKMVAENQMKKLTSDSSMLKSPKVSYTCHKCSRSYSTKNRLDEHIASVHQYSLRVTPKKNKLILSPSKVNKLIKSFSCLKCHQRFTNSELCKIHIIQHLKSEKQSNDDEFAGSSNAMVVDEQKENKNEFDDNLISTYIREDCTVNEKNDDEHRENHGKISEEKHSHTSGSASPMSVTVPEGYVVPLNDEHKKPYTLQSFIMREISENGNRFVNELQAYLPVLSTINEPIRVTFELSPLPQADAQIKNI